MSITVNKERIKKLLEGRIFRGAAVFAACVAAFVMAVQISTVQVGDATTLSQLDREIAALNAQIRQFQQQIAAYREQADSLATQIGILRSQEAAIQAEIDMSELQVRQLRDQIKNTEGRIYGLQGQLGDVIVDMHLARELSPLMRALSSRNIAEFIDREMAMSIVSSNLRNSITELQMLQNQLEADKSAVEVILHQQTNQRSSLVAVRAQQQHLLAVTRGTEQGYQQMRQAAQSELDALNAERLRLWQETQGGGNHIDRQPGQRAVRNFSGLQGCSGNRSGYPASARGLWGRWGCNYGMSTAVGVDNWGMFNRQCTSYAAMVLFNEFGRHITSFGGQGNAKLWPDTAPRIMGAVANNTPAVGSAAIWGWRDPNSRFGHVMIVRAILNDGWIRVSQFNYGNRPGEFSTMEIPIDSAVFVHFRAR
ncbi:CHAP domain-containing protein [Candidatus Saccharibacteria bacterium]|nr:CHAP domain-containing protein [Candidatus Saccharibacteria bacterium]